MFTIPAKNSLAFPKIAQKWGVTIIVAHLVGFLVYLVGF
jgi:hypothetical protein